MILGMCTSIGMVFMLYYGLYTLTYCRTLLALCCNALQYGAGGIVCSRSFGTLITSAPKLAMTIPLCLYNPLVCTEDPMHVVKY